MARDKAYREAEKKIEAARRSEAKQLDLSVDPGRSDSDKLTDLPKSLGGLSQLQSLNLNYNGLTSLPEWLGGLSRLKSLELGGNGLTSLPEWLGGLSQLQRLYLFGNGLTSLPEWLGGLSQLQRLYLFSNRLSDLPSTLGQLGRLEHLVLEGNPLNPELAAAYKEGLGAVKRYLRAKAEAQVVLNEAKLILIGEGEVGKSCLLGALRGDPWEEGRPTTHGIEIKPVKVTGPATGTEITLNGWDFGGQRVYRPTHQLFFSAPAVYLVVWKPRGGPQQGFVKEWIKLVKHREPEARILVVATHGGPKERQPDIDRQEIWDLFGEETVIDFFHVDSRPPTLKKWTRKRTGERKGIKELKDAIARVAAGLPEVGRSVPKRWQEVREELSQSKEAYLPLRRVFAICKEHKIEEDDARLLLRIRRRVGDLIWYEHDPVLRDIVVLKPDWLATAISFVLDDEQTRKNHGLARFERLAQLWNDPERPEENRHPAELHPIFLRLMERFNLSYRIAEVGRSEAECTSLIAQLVPDVRPDSIPEWPASPAAGDAQQVQICRIVDAAQNQSATAEGLFYQLIVRLHRYSLGRADYARSVHWQRGLVLEDDMGARAFLEHIGNDVRITVRSPYPERFLSWLTFEVKGLAEGFWKGIRCEVTVPCLMRRANGEPCIGLFEVAKLIENKRRNRPEQPCPVCNEWESIDQLLHNAPAARPSPIEELLADAVHVRQTLEAIRGQMAGQHAQVIGRFDQQDAASRELVSKVEAAYDGLMRTLVDEAKEGPRLFSFEPAEPGFFDRPKWISAKFRVTLWCEHSRRPLPALNGEGDKRGVYTLTLPRDWLVKAAPFLKVLTGTLSLVMPVASSATKLVLDDATYKGIEKQLELGQKSLDAVLKGGEKAGAWLSHGDAPDLERGEAIEARGSVLRQLQSWLKEKDPGFGGLVRVQNKRQEFLWVHPQFEAEY
jgi:internalin A